MVQTSGQKRERNFGGFLRRLCSGRLVWRMLLTVKGMGFMLCDFEGRGSIVPITEGLMDAELQFACACLSTRGTDRRQSGMQAGRFRHRSVTLDNTPTESGSGFWAWSRSLRRANEPIGPKKHTGTIKASGWRPNIYTTQPQSSAPSA